MNNCPVHLKSHRIITPTQIMVGQIKAMFISHLLTTFLNEILKHWDKSSFTYRVVLLYKNMICLK